MRILFLVLVLRTPLPIAGLIEGIAESTASLLKIFVGPHGRPAEPPQAADPVRLHRLQPCQATPRACEHLVRPLVLIFLDRVGKGVRGSPRDAMMADSRQSSTWAKPSAFTAAWTRWALLSVRCSPGYSCSF